MTRKSIFTLLIACFVFVNTYAQNLQNNIPKDATFVVTLNPAVLNSKVKFAKLKEFDFFKMGMEEMSKQAGPMASEIKKFINDPAEFGMDLMSSSYMFGKVEGGNMRMGMVMKVADKAKFDNLINTYIAPMVPVKEANKMKYVSMEGMNMSWNANQIMFSGVQLEYQDEEDYTTHKKRMETESGEWMNAIASGNLTNSIASHPKFKMANVNKDDVNFWADYETFAKMSNEMSGAGGDPMTKMMMESMSWMYDEAYVSMGLNFNKGAASLNTKYFMNDKMNDIYKKLFDASFNKKFLKYLPKNNLGYLSMNFNMANLVEMIKSSDNEMLAQLPLYEGMAVDALKGMGVEMAADDLYKLWKGDIMFVVTGVKEFEKEVVTYEFDDDFNKKEVKQMKKEKLPEFIMMMSHGSKDNVLKLIDLGKQSSMIGEQKGFFQLNIPDVPMDVFLKVEKDMIIVSNNMNVVKKKARKVFKRKNLISAGEASKIMSNTQRLVIDIPKVMDELAAMEDFNLEGPEGMMFNMGKENLESLVINTDKKIINGLKGDFHLNFSNKNMNSLEQIFGMINEAVNTMMGGSSM